MREGWLPHRTHTLQPVTRNLTHTLGWAGWDPELINNLDSNPELSNELHSIFRGKMQEAIQEGARSALLHLRHRRHPVPISHPPPAPSVDPARGLLSAGRSPRGPSGGGGGGGGESGALSEPYLRLETNTDTGDAQWDACSVFGEDELADCFRGYE